MHHPQRQLAYPCRNHMVEGPNRSLIDAAFAALAGYLQAFSYPRLYLR